MLVWVLRRHAAKHCQQTIPEVHEQDIVDHYDVLKEYLLEFAHTRLPDLEDHKAPCTAELWQCMHVCMYCICMRACVY